MSGERFLQSVGGALTGSLPNPTIASAQLLLAAADANVPNGIVKILTSYKSTDQSVTNSAALVADSALSLTLSAGVTYFVTGFLYLVTGTGGIQIDMAGGSATVTSMILTGVVPGSVATNLALPSALATALVNASALVGTVGLMVQGSLDVNAGGTIIPRFAQAIATPANSATVKRGSWLQAVRL